MLTDATCKSLVESDQGRFSGDSGVERAALDREKRIVIVLVGGSRRIFRLRDFQPWQRCWDLRGEEGVAIRGADDPGMPDDGTQGIDASVPDDGEPVHPGQDASLLQGFDGHPHAVAVAAGLGRDGHVAGETAAGLGIVEVPEDSPQYVERDPGERANVLTRLPVAGRPSAGKGHDLGLGVTVERP